MNPRAYQYRPSADRLGNAPFVHGKLQPMQTEREGFLRRLLRRERKERVDG